MPTYDYECDNCSHILEVFQSFSESPKKKCPECGKFTLRRLISGGIGLVFKSSGFYVTDNRPAREKTSDSSTNDKGGDTKTKDVSQSNTTTNGDVQTSKESPTKTKSDNSSTQSPNQSTSHSLAKSSGKQKK